MICNRSDDSEEGIIDVPIKNGYILLMGFLDVK